MAKKNAKTPTPAQKTEKPVVEKATEPVVSTEPANDVVEATTESGFSDLLKKLTEWLPVSFATVKQETRALEKRLTRELKAAQKASAKKKAGKGNCSPLAL